MRVEVVGVGSELLSGKPNTNIAYIGERLNSIGIILDCGTTVGDDVERMKSVFTEIFSRAEVVIITGGLGPTFDDLTREVVAQVLNKKMTFNREMMQKIAKHFVDRGLDMPKGNEKQAYIISGAKVIDNKIGTAPGQIIQVKSQKLKVKDVILLPGPPREIHPMFESPQGVLPYLKQKYERKIVKSKVLHIYGLTESKVNEIISPVVETERKLESEHISFSILAHRAIIDIKINIQGDNELLIDELIRNVKREFYDVLKENIYGEDNQTLESVVGELLTKNKKTLAIAESCTGGMISNRITNIPGSSLYFREGVIVYSNQAKIDLLGVKPETLEKHGAVSKETVLEMVSGIKRVAVSDYALAISGIAGPGGATEGKPAGLVYFGLASPSHQKSQEMKFTGSRLQIKERATNYALDFLRRALIKK